MPVCAGNIKSSLIPCVLCSGLAFKPDLKCEGFSFVRCLKCGLVQRNPQPDKDEIITRYSTTFGKDYLSYELDNESAFLKLQQLALKDAKFDVLEKKLFSFSDTPPSILDIGCATGALLAFLRDAQPGFAVKGSAPVHRWRVTGVEISPCAEYAKNTRKLDVRNIALEENKFPHSSFDVILASHLIEHLNDPRAFLAETNRILKKGGHVFITTPNISGFQAHIYGSAWRSAIYDHLYLFSKNTLKKLLLSTGFKPESCHTWGGLAAGMAPKWLKKFADFFAKRFGCGDVMIIRAKK
jgi:2-polyprenyl-3-methyl-5-hydroxy-6-metoxy-1,4-benzoquinol methylase